MSWGNVTCGALLVNAILASIVAVAAQSGGDFWWLNEQLVGVAKVEREKNQATAHVFTAHDDDEVAMTTEEPLTMSNAKKSVSVKVRPNSRRFMFPDEFNDLNSWPTDPPPRYEKGRLLGELKKYLKAINEGWKPVQGYMAKFEKIQEETDFEDLHERLVFS